MVKCLEKNIICVGRDYRVFSNGSFVRSCCINEINEEIELVQTIVDIIDDCSVDFKNLKRLSSRLSYAAHTINKNNDYALMEMFPVINRFATLIYEYKDKIVHDSDIRQLAMSFTMELKKWFQQKFLFSTEILNIEIIQKSILVDINTIEMSLGICMIDFDDDFDDMFF